MINEQIRDKEVRLIGADGQQLGIMSAREAQKHAVEAGLDLVKIAPTAKPPVCKIIDYGKYKYELARKEKEAKKKQKTIEIKEVRLSNRLVDAPACVVADPEDPNAAMMKMMKQMGAMGMGGDIPEPKPILELNPNHTILTKLLLSNDEAKTAEIAHLLLEEAKLLEGGKLKDVNSFVKRLNTLLEKTL